MKVYRSLASFLILQNAIAQVVVEKLTPEDFYQRVISGNYDVIVDVRRRDDEWNVGHVPNATLVDSLASYTGDDSTSPLGKPSDLAGCEHCEIIVYCRSGARAGRAIEILREQGFKGRLWNGQGVNQWTQAGYGLVTTDSIVPRCTVDQNVSDACYNKYLSYSSDRNSSGGGPSQNGDTDDGTGTEKSGGNEQDKSIGTLSPSESSPGTRLKNFPWLIALVGKLFVLGY